MNSKLMMFFVAMALSVGFMHHRYSKLNERMQAKAAADKARLAEAKFERLDFSPAAIDDDTKRGNVDACLQSKGRFFSYNIADNHWDDFCRCLSVHYVAHVFPLVEENCRAPGRIDFTEAGCALVDPKKPRQLEDRVVKIGEECSAWVKAGGSVNGGGAAPNNAAWAAHQANNPNGAYPPSAPAQPGYGNPAAGNPAGNPGNPGMPPAGNPPGGNPWPPPGFGGPDGAGFTAPTEQQNYIPPSGGPQGQPFTPPPAPPGGYPPPGTNPPNGFQPPAGYQPPNGY